MYPSLFPLRLKRPWHLGAPFQHDTKEDELNALVWPRISGGEAGLHSFNSPSLAMGSWMQPRLETTLLGSELNQYQPMTAAALEGIRGADFLKQQLPQNQQPFQFLQQPITPSHLLQHQDFQQALQQQITSSQSPRLLENQPNSLPHPQPAHSYADTFQIPNNHVQQLSSLPSQFYEKSIFPDPSLYAVQGILGSAYPEGNASLLSSQLGHSMTGQQSQQPLGPKLAMAQGPSFGTGFQLPPFPEKDGSGVQNLTSTQNHAQFRASKDPSSLLSIAAPNLTTNATSSPSTIQNSLYGYLDESSSLLQNTVEIGPQTQTFVKVCKSGSVGRSLDISRFSNYDELRVELGHMFGIEGLLEDPRRSGWQLVFVDRENDVLLLGDDPWESFVNNVWYIKILSPEDVQKMGKHGVEPPC
ncbi:auxin response factor 12-like isoform X1 [Canna indica]|uniref:Auxin-responsive protein n=1 Tax=Canna indica TaxID=4628 RepID=A0AAQ3KKW9_9LILI|nr:auxin response factor 12-like isoform X1 [Canna indica]